MNPELVKRMSAPVPRYTSYPTAPHFTTAVGSLQFAEALSRLDPAKPLSLYVHIPFCAQLCWYCGCNTKATRNAATIHNYFRRLETEILMAAALTSGSRLVSHIHWGGGSPNSLSAAEIVELGRWLTGAFQTTQDTEFAVEIDPRWLDAAQVAAFAQAGVNRASIGVQDFNPAVQAAINREQSFALTKNAVDSLRAAGVRGINIDLVYGLPHQTRNSVADTISQVMELNPDRIALFGYAHLPSRAKHQRLIDEKALPDSVERYAQSRRAQRLLMDAGYVAVGLDHFAKPSDPLASGAVKRNFQGYTTDTAEALIGFGASSISQLPDGYFQNAVSRQDYERRIDETGLATVRGVLLTQDDKMRALVIERLMCDFEFSRAALLAAFGSDAAPVIQQAEELVSFDNDGLVEKTTDGFRVTSKGQPFVRAIAACFDVYFSPEKTRYSAGV